MSTQKTREELLEANIKMLSEDICANLVRTKQLSDQVKKLHYIELRGEILWGMRQRDDVTAEEIEQATIKLLNVIRGTDEE